MGACVLKIYEFAFILYFFLLLRRQCLIQFPFYCNNKIFLISACAQYLYCKSFCFSFYAARLLVISNFINVYFNFSRFQKVQAGWPESLTMLPGMRILALLLCHKYSVFILYLYFKSFHFASQLFTTEKHE